MNRIELYEKIIFSNAGVLYLKGFPGIGKTALIDDIAKRNGMAFYDIRLTQMDELDLLGKPTDVEYKGRIVMDYNIPKWLVQATEQPSIILFDEINRAQLAKRNAALRILNERIVGDLKLPDHTHIVCAGNLGEEDGTEVEELDTAINNRLVHLKYDPDFTEWKSIFAERNVNNYIIQFIEANPETFYVKPTENSDAFASPRMWTNFSKLVGKNAPLEEVFSLAKIVAHGYIGLTAHKFVRWLEDTAQVSINDIIERWDSVSAQVKKFNRDRKSELINSLKEYPLVTLSSSENGEAKLSNISKFIKLVDEDEQVAFLNDYIDGISIEDLTENKLLHTFLKSFSKIFKKIHILSK